MRRPPSSTESDRNVAVDSKHAPKDDCSKQARVAEIDILLVVEWFVAASTAHQDASKTVGE